MANYQFPFDAEVVSGAPDRSYQAEVWAKYFGSFIGNGIFYDPTTSLMVVENLNEQSMHIYVKSGSAFINGRFFYESEDTLLGIEQADPVLNRVDAVVLRCDYIQRTLSLAVVKGTPAVSPTAPNLTRTNDIYELQLATISVPFACIRIQQSQITDTRLNNAVCGVVAGVIENIDTTQLFNQYMSAWQQVYSQMLNHAAQFSSGFLCYGVASGTGAYTVTAEGFTLNEGAEIKVRFPNAFTGQATLNVNGLGAKNICRADGTPYNIIANSIQRLTYDGVNFQPASEGGWGTARPEQVLQGVTATNDEGYFDGAMPENATINHTLTTQGGSINIPSGYYPQQGKVTATFPVKTAVNGTISTHNGTFTVPAGYYSANGTVKAVMSGMDVSKIKKDYRIGNMLGTMLPGAVKTSYKYAPSNSVAIICDGNWQHTHTYVAPDFIQGIFVDTTSTSSYYREAILLPCMGRTVYNGGRRLNNIQYDYIHQYYSWYFDSGSNHSYAFSVSADNKTVKFYAKSEQPSFSHRPSDVTILY